MFLYEDAGGEGFRGVVGHDGDIGLGDHGALVVLFVNDVDADAGDAFACGDNGGVDSLAVHSLPAEFWQEGGMYIQDAVSVTAQCHGAEFSHVSGEGDKLDSVCGQGICDGGVQMHQTGVGDGAEVGGGDIHAAGAFQSEGAGVVGDDHPDFGVEGAIGAGVNDGLEVGSAMGCEDADGEFFVLRDHSIVEQSLDSRFCGNDGWRTRGSVWQNCGLVRANFLGFHYELVHLELDGYGILAGETAEAEAVFRAVDGTEQSSDAQVSE